MKMVRSKLVEDDGDVLKVLRPRGAVDKNIIKENEQKPTQVGVEDVVHQSLEGRRGVGEAKRHHQELEVAMMSPKRRLGDIIRVHPHLVVARTEVELGEEACPCSSSRSSSTTGMGNLSLDVLALRAR
jgi:hypothetical protein